jgi:hypothetical protein
MEAFERNNLFKRNKIHFKAIRELQIIDINQNPTFHA